MNPRLAALVLAGAALAGGGALLLSGYSDAATTVSADDFEGKAIEGRTVQAVELGPAKVVTLDPGDFPSPPDAGPRVLKQDAAPLPANAVLIVTPTGEVLEGRQGDSLVRYPGGKFAIVSRAVMRADGGRRD